MKNGASRARLPILVIVALLLGLATGGSALADIKLGPGKEKDKDEKKADEKRMDVLGGMIPEVKPAQVSFVAGRSVEVELDAAAAMVTGLRFVIREQPGHGRLSEVRPHPTERHKAVVTYTHTGGDEHLQDGFSYACRINDGPFSAPGKVTLNGRRAEPKLMILRQAQFGRVLPGTEVMAKFEVANRGIGPYVADLRWPAPWKGPPKLVLGIGETAELAVMVTPQQPGVLSEEITLQEGNPMSRVRLWLQCEQPFIVTPSRAQMSYDFDRGLRWVKAKIANATKSTIKLRLDLPERLNGPAEVEIGAGKLQEVELTLAGDDVSAFQGEVRVTDGVLSERLILGASPEPAQVSMVAPVSGLLQFGSHAQGEAAKATLVLANRGGEAAVMAVQAPPPFRVAEEEQNLSVAPGETQKLVMEVQSGKSGRYQGKIVISGGGNRLELNAEATFVDPEVIQMRGGPAAAKKGGTTPAVKVARPKAAPMATAPVEDEPPAELKVKPSAGPAPVRREAVTMLGKVNNETAAVLSYLSVFGAPIPQADLSRKYDKLEGIELTARGRDYLELAWEKPNPDAPPQSYRVEAAQQVFEPRTNLFFRSWSPMPEVKEINPGSGRSGVRLTGLHSAAQYEVRVMAVDERGKVSPPSDIYVLSTMPPWRMPDWMWISGALLLLGGLLWQARRLYLKRMGLTPA